MNRHRDWPIALFIFVLVGGVLLALVLLKGGFAAMCATHQTADGHGALAYCSDYQGQR